MKLLLLRCSKVQMIEKATRMKNNEGKEAECPDDTSPVDIEEGVNDKKDENYEKR